MLVMDSWHSKQRCKRKTNGARVRGGAIDDGIINLLLNFSTLNPTVGTISRCFCSSGLKWFNTVVFPELSSPTTSTLHSQRLSPNRLANLSKNPISVDAVRHLLICDTLLQHAIKSSWCFWYLVYATGCSYGTLKYQYY